MYGSVTGYCSSMLVCQISYIHVGRECLAVSSQCDTVSLCYLTTEKTSVVLFVLSPVLHIIIITLLLRYCQHFLVTSWTATSIVLRPSAGYSFTLSGIINLEGRWCIHSVWWLKQVQSRLALGGVAANMPFGEGKSYAVGDGTVG